MPRLEHSRRFFAAQALAEARFDLYTYRVMLLEWKMCMSSPSTAPTEQKYSIPIEHL